MKTIYCRRADEFERLTWLGPCAPKFYFRTKKTAGRVAPWELFPLAVKRSEGGWNLAPMQVAMVDNSAAPDRIYGHPKAFALAIRYLGLPEAHFLSGPWGPAKQESGGMFSRRLSDHRSQLVNFEYAADEHGFIFRADWAFYVGPAAAVEVWCRSLQGEFGTRKEDVLRAMRAQDAVMATRLPAAEWDRVWPAFV